MLNTKNTIENEKMIAGQTLISRSWFCYEKIVLKD